MNKPLKDMSVEDLRNLSRDELIGIIMGLFMQKGLFRGKLKRRLKDGTNNR